MDLRNVISKHAASVVAMSMSEIRQAAEQATRGWKRLPEYVEPKYVRNLDGTLWIIEDLRGQKDRHPWEVRPLDEWEQGTSIGEGLSWDYDTLAEAKAHAKGGV